MVVVIAATEDRVGRKFSRVEIRDGTFASFIRDEDFDILNKVSVPLPFLSQQVVSLELIQLSSTTKRVFPPKDHKTRNPFMGRGFYCAVQRALYC